MQRQLVLTLGLITPIDNDAEIDFDLSVPAIFLRFDMSTQICLESHEVWDLALESRIPLFSLRQGVVFEVRNNAVVLRRNLAAAERKIGLLDLGIARDRTVVLQKYRIQ